MSLLGIDVGTSGCKAAVFSEEGQLLALAYEEYDYQHPQPGWAELDSRQVWESVQRTIAQVAQQAQHDPIKALSVSSLGEAVVPVTRHREILGPSLLNFDARGAEYLPELRERIDDERLYRINGNTLGNQYSLTKLKWIQQHQPELYQQTDHFLHWSGFVSFMLGAEATVDYSLANRTLLFDLEHGDWSDEICWGWLNSIGSKLPPTVPAGTIIGTVSRAVADRLGLPRGRGDRQRRTRSMLQRRGLRRDRTGARDVRHGHVHLHDAGFRAAPRAARDDRARAEHRASRRAGSLREFHL